MGQREHAAVFARNHEKYLKRAAEIHAETPGKGVTFRSKLAWAEASRLVLSQGDIPIYFSAVESKGLVAFEARLVEVHVISSDTDLRARQLLEQALQETADEGLWQSDDGPLKTLYVVKECRSLADPFPMTSLIKLSNGEPIHPRYAYSYLPVYDRAWRSVDGQVALLPDEDLACGQYPEGTRQRVYVNRYERNPRARAACIRTHGAVCQACGFDFGETYGEIGQGFIHVHHTVPLPDMGDGYEVDPINDLAPVCPNCHAMLHRNQESPLTLDELRRILKRDRKT